MCVFSVNRFKNIWASLTFLPSSGSSLKRYLIVYHFRTCFLKEQLKFYYGVSHRSVSRDENGEFGP